MHCSDPCLHTLPTCAFLKIYQYLVLYNIVKDPHLQMITKEQSSQSQALEKRKRKQETGYYGW